MGMGIVSHYYFKKKSNKELEQSLLSESVNSNNSKPSISIVALKIFVITAGTLLGMGFQLIACIKLPGTNDLMHFYDATSECYDGYWVLGLGLIVSVIIFFLYLSIRMTRQSPSNRMDPSNIYYGQFVKPYKSQYWYFEFILTSRRFFIALFSSLRVYTEANVDIILLALMAIYFALQCVIRPFKWKRLNIVEGVCLFSLLLVIGSSTHSSRNNQDFTDTFIGFVIILPFLFVFVYVLIAIRNVRDQERKQIEKAKARAPVSIKNEFDDANCSKIQHSDDMSDDQQKLIATDTVIDRNQSISTSNITQDHLNEDVELHDISKHIKSTPL